MFTTGRLLGALLYSPDIAEVMASFGAQAGAALELADRRCDAEQLLVSPDRDRIARDRNSLEKNC